MPTSSVDLPASFERHLRAENKSVHAIETHLEVVLRLDGFLAARCLDLAAATREDLETFLAELLPAGSRPPPPTATAPCGSSLPGWRRARSPPTRWPR